MRIRSPRLLITCAASCAIALGLAMSGCAKAQPQTVTDPNGLFHVVVPPDWQANPMPGFITLYAADELPQTDDQAYSSLTVSIYSSGTTGTAEVKDQLVPLLESRAKDRTWKKQDFKDPKPAVLGKREGWSVDFSGTDDKGRDFAGRAILLRTNDTSILVFAVSPAKDWTTHAESVDMLMDEWYWHTPERETSSTS